MTQVVSDHPAVTRPGRGIIPRPGTFGTLLSALITLLLTMNVAAAGEVTNPLELRVCADPDWLPYSNRAGEGFENRIAEVVAAELGASLVYDWVSFSAPDNVRTHHVELGHCDLVFGLEDGAEGYLTSVAYLRSPFSFIQRADTPTPVSSFDDLQELDLRIGFEDNQSAPYSAIVPRGLQEKAAMLNVRGLYGESGWAGRIVDEVIAGNIDVGIAFGPVAGYFAARSEVPLRVVDVSPQIEPPFLLMMRSVVVGFRPHDTALRDLVNSAISSGWDEIQEILTEFAVPVMAQPVPLPAQERDEELKVGVVLPTPPSGTRQRSLLDPAALAAWRGAELGASDAQRSNPELLLLHADAPDAVTAGVAAERLVATDGVDALIGGLGAGQAQVLAEVAASAGIPFLNIGPSWGACSAWTYNLEPHATAYLQALVQLDAIGPWHLAHSADSDDVADLAGQQLVEAGIQVAGRSSIAAEQLVFQSVFRQVSEGAADTILVLLPADQAQEFLTQAAVALPDVRVLVLPDAGMQSRADYQYLLNSGPQTSTQRVSAWDASLEVSVNQDFASRFGEPLDPTGWATYAAVTILAEAQLERPDNLAAALGRPNGFHVGKDLVFHPGSRTFVGDMYELQLESAPSGPTAAERLSLVNRTALAQVVNAFPSIPAADCE